MSDTPKTTEQNKPLSDNEKRRKAVEANRAAMQLLLDAYPQVFDLENTRPLKVGIHADLAVDEKLSKTKIRKALSSYVRQYTYYQCITEGAQRIDLAQNEAGLVTAEEAKHAQESIAQIEAKREERLNKRKKTQQFKKVKQEKEVRLTNKLQDLVSKTNQRTS
ncbi:ProQ/FINO family protein [Marinicellulosiphila megalodicopiae]|uniref:ProQ/FINO family protein n=1 Tax=Marinicellulosiphila megalodicopiae TaxID=2724896 RepID=UPI003BAE8E3C